MFKTGANDVICWNNANGTAVYHYVNKPYFTVELINETEKDVGLSNTNVEVNDGNLTCRFTRKNNHTHENYYSLGSNNTYIIFAFGDGKNIYIFFKY